MLIINPKNESTLLIPIFFMDKHGKVCSHTIYQRYQDLLVKKILSEISNIFTCLADSLFTSYGLIIQ